MNIRSWGAGLLMVAVAFSCSWGFPYAESGIRISESVVDPMLPGSWADLEPGFNFATDYMASYRVTTFDEWNATIFWLETTDFTEQGWDPYYSAWPATLLQRSWWVTQYQFEYRTSDISRVFSKVGICALYTSDPNGVAKDPMETGALRVEYYDSQQGDFAVLDVPSQVDHVGRVGNWDTYVIEFDFADMDINTERVRLTMINLYPPEDYYIGPPPAPAHLWYEPMISSVSLEVADFVAEDCAELWQAGLGDPADLNRDCVVDLRDFAIFAGEWLACIGEGCE